MTGSPRLCFGLALERLVNVERLLGLEVYVHDGAYGLNHGKGVTLEDVSVRVYGRGSALHGATGHVQRVRPDSPVGCRIIRIPVEPGSLGRAELEPLRCGGDDDDAASTRTH